MSSNAPSTPDYTLLNIQGRASVSALAERAKLDIVVSDSGFDKDQVSKNVANAVNAVQTDLDSLVSRLDNGDISPSSPITLYSIAALSLSTDDMSDDVSHRADPTKKVHVAESTINIHLRDFAVLGDLVVRLSSMQFVGLRGLEWYLTDAKKAWLEDEVRVLAFKVAKERARAYAQILGKDLAVKCVQIEDLMDSWPGPYMLAQARGKVAGVEAFAIGAGIQFEPGNVEISGTVRAEFHVRTVSNFG